MSLSLKIGELAERTACLVETVRFYERSGILPPPQRGHLALWLVGDVIMQVQVRLEESFLNRQHGANYLAYCERTRRWI